MGVALGLLPVSVCVCVCVPLGDCVSVCKEDLAMPPWVEMPKQDQADEGLMYGGQVMFTQQFKTG